MPIDDLTKQRLENFFEYKWANDRNHPFTDPKFQNIVIQLPRSLIETVFTKYLFGDFLKMYTRNLFDFPKNNGNLNSRYVWHDYSYREFMLKIMTSLEPMK